MNPWERLGLTHISPSQVNTYLEDPAYWLATKVLKKRTSIGPAAMRGQAVETGVATAVFDANASIEECQNVAIKQFKSKTAFDRSEARDRELKNISPMVEQAIDALDELKLGQAEPPARGIQHAIKISIEGLLVPVIGFLDFKFPESGTIVDLKTTTRMPSYGQIKPRDARQGAVYKRAHGNFDMKFVYVTPKKALAVSLENADYHFKVVVETALHMQRFLSLSADPEELLALVHRPDPDIFYWGGNEHIRSELFGY